MLLVHKAEAGLPWCKEEEEAAQGEGLGLQQDSALPGTEGCNGTIYSSCLAERLERQGLIVHREWYWQEEQMAIFRFTGKYFK